jgi:hypothetical protein
VVVVPNEMRVRGVKQKGVLVGSNWSIFKFPEPAPKETFATLSFQTSFPPEISSKFQEPKPGLDQDVGDHLGQPCGRAGFQRKSAGEEVWRIHSPGGLLGLAV